MKRLSLNVLVFFSGLLLLIGCERSAYYGMTEGKIVYDIEVDSDKMPPMMRALMPSEAVTWFSNGKSCTVLEGGAGMFENRLLFDPEKDLFATLTSLMGEKTARVMSLKSIEKDRKGYDAEFKLEHTGVKKEIAGIMCKEVLVRVDSSNVSSVFYTDELDVKAPDMIATMFGGLEGLMMEYQVNQMGFKLKMKAKKISADKPDPELFTIPKDYTIQQKK